MQDIIQRLDAMRTLARLGGGQERIDTQHAVDQIILELAPVAA